MLLITTGIDCFGNLVFVNREIVLYCTESKHSTTCDFGYETTRCLFSSQVYREHMANRNFAPRLAKHIIQEVAVDDVVEVFSSRSSTNSFTACTSLTFSCERGRHGRFVLSYGIPLNNVLLVPKLLMALLYPQRCSLEQRP